MRFQLIVISCILLAALLRVWNLDSLPPSLNWDEVSLGYNSYSILHTLKDEWGEFLPLSFRAYGDYKLPGFGYLDIPFIAIFGLNEWGVRLPSAILGVGTVIFLLAFLKKVANIHVTSWVVFLAAILPWSIILSRIALEANVALFFTVAAVYFFYCGLEMRKFLYASSLLFGLTIFTYNSNRVITPLLIISLGLIFWKKIKEIKREALISFLIFAVFFAVALPNALLQDSSARYRWTSILDEGAINKINELRGSSALPPALAAVSFNKVTFLAPEIVKNYVSHFDPNFLFLNGGSNYQFSVPGSGLLYPILAPFLFFGFWRIFVEKQKWQIFVIFWLFISIIPAAITRDSPHALRSIMMFPALIIICAIGLDWFVGFFKINHLFIKTSIVLILLLSLYNFWINYTGDYQRHYSWSWQYGYKQITDYIKLNGDQYDKIYITKKYGEPHEFLLFYMQYDPAKFRNDPNLNRYFRSDWYWVDSFDKYIFINDWEVRENVQCPMSNIKCLLITSPGNYSDNSKLLETINFLDGKPAFDIVELAQVQ